jgi:hypothetical protein
MSPTNEIMSDIAVLIVIGLLGLILYLSIKVHTWWLTSTKTPLVPQTEDEVQSDIGVEAHAPGVHTEPKSYKPSRSLGPDHKFNRLIGYPPDSPQS